MDKNKKITIGSIIGVVALVIIAVVAINVTKTSKTPKDDKPIGIASTEVPREVAKTETLYVAVDAPRIYASIEDKEPKTVELKEIKKGQKLFVEIINEKYGRFNYGGKWYIALADLTKTKPTDGTEATESTETAEGTESTSETTVATNDSNGESNAGSSNGSDNSGSNSGGLTDGESNAGSSNGSDNSGSNSGGLTDGESNAGDTFIPQSPVEPQNKNEFIDADGDGFSDVDYWDDNLMNLRWERVVPHNCKDGNYTLYVAIDGGTATEIDNTGFHRYLFDWEDHIRRCEGYSTCTSCNKNGIPADFETWELVGKTESGADLYYVYYKPCEVCGAYLDFPEDTENTKRFKR